MSLAPPDLHGLTILVAEDNTTSREVVCAMLETMGARTVHAVNGLDALERVRAARPDLILLDLEMPEMSGIDVLQVLAGDADAPPVICLTGHTEEAYMTRVTGLGAAGLIAKPIQNIAAMGQVVRQAAHRGGQKAKVVPIGKQMQGALDMSVFAPLAKMMGPQMIRKVLAQMETDIAKTMRELDEAVATADFSMARAAAHVLVSVAGSIGARQITTQARKISMAAHALDHAGLADAVAPLPEQLELAIAAFSTEIERG